MSAPVGWYPDPDPAAPAGTSRYWDGNAWTEHVRSDAGTAGAPAPQQGSYQASPAQSHGQNPYGQTDYGQAPMYAGDVVGGKATHAPGGQELAGYLRRVVAYLIDGLLITLIMLAVGWSFISQISATFNTFINQSIAATETGGVAPDQAQFMADLAGPIFALQGIAIAVNLIYFCGFWRWRAATPGKMVLGLRIRAWEADGPLSWGLVLRRWFGLNLGTIISVIPLIGFIGGFWPIIDLLWPLWDQRRQALHDKIAGSVVIRDR